MWPTWLKSPRRTHSTPKHAPFSFSCSSFKDIQSLCEEPFPRPSTPRSPSFLFRRIQISASLLRFSHRNYSAASETHHSPPQPSIALPNGDHHQGIVVYYTSLRVIRKTFEDCRAVRSILRGFRVFIDERDLSIDDSFREELQEILGRRCASLPMVFIGGVLIGGAEEIQRLHESGELRELIERLPSVKHQVCDCCGGLRFVLCGACNGSHKIYKEKYGFRSCTVCNINGHVRCASCSFTHLRRT